MEVCVMRRFFAALTIACAALLLAPSAKAQDYYYGAWEFGNDGTEYLYLGDNMDGTYLYLRGDRGYCGRPGASYTSIRQILLNQVDDVSWWIDDYCSSGRRDFVRICVENDYGQRACSTYRDMGWTD